MKSLNAVMTALLEELSEEIPDVLTQEFSLATIWADACRHAGEPVPRDVAAVLDTPLDILPPAANFTPQRGSFADHRSQFPELYAD